MTHFNERARQDDRRTIPASHHRQATPGPRGELGADAYTPWQTRALASLIDTVPLAVVWGLAQVIGNFAPSLVGMIIQLAALAAVVGYAAWNYGYRQGTTGSSVGKSFMKFMVVSEKTNQPIGFGPSLIRQLAHGVDGIVCYAGFLFPLWDAKRQTLADKIMATVCRPISQ